MYTERTAFDPKAQTATFTWYFPASGEAIPLHVHPGDAPGALAVTIGEEPSEVEGMIYYTDYENCVVGDIEFQGQVCSLWTRKELKDAVPQDCIEHFVDTCGVEVPAHSRDLCPDGEGDY
ncbi:uncharacterized protein LOC125946595 [Dermacentor silvarum]|uniref:uncharacterized protein LOC125946595 n=1 Tax=Dermacentor silvarum TaxID=543639 RepID=UPI00210183A2|nr:uncharacterized protein LOC125946595 [Dermacentor silvarum]